MKDGKSVSQLNKRRWGVKALKLLTVFLVFAFLQSLWADEVVLQNGLNSYDGCEDAWIADWYSTNTGNQDTLFAELEQCDG